MIGSMWREGRTAASCLLVVAFLALPSSAAAGGHEHPMQRVALVLAAIIRRDARQDRHAPGTLVRRSAESGTQRLTLFYTARAGQYAPSGGYALTVVTRRGVLRDVTLSAFRQTRIYRPGAKRERSGGFDIDIERTGARWDGTYGGSEEGRCEMQPNDTTTCEGGAFSDDYGEGEAAELLAKAETLIAAARHHEPV